MGGLAQPRFPISLTVEAITMAKPIAAVTISTGVARRVMSPAAWDLLSRLAEVRVNPHDRSLTEDELAGLLSDADVCLSGWGGGRLTAAVLDRAPKLRMVGYAAGSVKPVVTDAMWERGIRITSAAPAIALDVAETTLALIIASVKRIWQCNQITHHGGWTAQTPMGPSREMNGSTIGIVGAGHVGRRVMELLKMFSAKVLLFDPYFTDAQAAQYQATKVELPELMSQSDVVSLHAPITDETHHMINASMLRLMKDGATLINTARGWLVDEAALAAEVQTGRIFACIDVTDPEPPAPDSPLRKLDNVVLTPHIAGCVTNCTRLGELAVEEIRRFLSGEPLLFEVTREMLSICA
jgi:phosphoglycerate dehydrogenase-like enzyme